MRHANTQSGIPYTRQHQHLQASGDARRVSGVRVVVCVARSMLRCEEVLCCGCRLMWMPSELEDDSPLQPPARATRSRAGGPCPPVLRPGAPPYPRSTSVSSNGPSPAPFHLPKLIRSSIAVYCILSSGVTEVWILYIYKSKWCKYSSIAGGAACPQPTYCVNQSVVKSKKVKVAVYHMTATVVQKISSVRYKLMARGSNIRYGECHFNQSDIRQ